MEIEKVLGRVSAGEDLASSEMELVIDQIMRGSWPRERIALLLTALRTKGETVEEIAGAARAMRRHMSPIRHQRSVLVDTCGTGGDGSRTFNVSTAAALVTAAAGVAVAKHGNRKVTSRTGSADVLGELGVDVEAPVAVVERCLDELGVCFCFAQQLHPAMRHVAEVRRMLKAPTIFNLLGPLTNPASAPYQLLGVGRAELRHKLAAVLARLGARRAVVVTGDDGLDEVTLSGPTQVIVVREGQVQATQWTPEQFGIPRRGLEETRVDSPAESARMIRAVLEGQTGAARDLVVLNAAAAIWLSGQADDLHQCAILAQESIDGGTALSLLERLAELSRSA